MRQAPHSAVPTSSRRSTIVEVKADTLVCMLAARLLNSSPSLDRLDLPSRSTLQTRIGPPLPNGWPCAGSLVRSLTSRHLRLQPKPTPLPPFCPSTLKTAICLNLPVPRATAAATPSATSCCGGWRSASGLLQASAASSSSWRPTRATTSKVCHCIYAESALAGPSGFNVMHNAGVTHGRQSPCPSSMHGSIALLHPLVACWLP